MAAHFLLCPILHFMDRTSHAAVSSSHTVDVQSSPGEVTHSPSWGLQNSTGLSACFSRYTSSCSSIHLSSLMPLRVVPPSLTANILKAFSIATLYLACTASKAALQRVPFTARVTGVSLPSVQDLYQSHCLQRTGDINKTSLIPSISCFPAVGQKGTKTWNNKVPEQFLLVRNRSTAETVFIYYFLFYLQFREYLFSILKALFSILKVTFNLLFRKNQFHTPHRMIYFGENNVLEYFIFLL